MRSEETDIDLDSQAGLNDEPAPACISCRKRKRKCSRGRPCEQCAKSGYECSYNDESEFRYKSKAIDTLGQRVENLERMFLAQSLLMRQALTPFLSGKPMDTSAVNLSLPPDLKLADELRITERQFRTQLGETPTTEDESSPKRRKLSYQVDSIKETGDSSGGFESIGSPLHAANDILPPDDLLEKCIHKYFLYVHPWTPMLHRRKFMAAFSTPSKRKLITPILHAIVTTTARFMDDPRLKSRRARENLVQNCRQRVLLQTIESYSVENLQALIIIAFDLIGAGKGPKTWSIVDSMTRIVEHLQLSFEERDIDHNRSNHQKMFHRLNFLSKSESWVEEEERRRIFWCVFMLDRFCSVSAGWNPSLTPADAKRRLPCSGHYWADEIPVKTRYFGIGEYEDPKLTSYEKEEITSLGGLAYCVEATESLSRVTRFYLDQELSLQNRESFQAWMMKFRELDLDLAKWKHNLPAEWKGLLPRYVNADGKKVMDENLTLAHVTHNASVILLHQYIAYPYEQWPTWTSKLSKEVSVETCISAATEICNMAKSYVDTNEGVTNPQFSFCLFVAGRVLLSNSAYYGDPILPEFHELVGLLSELAERWQGRSQTESNLARNFALTLSTSSKKPNRKEVTAAVDLRLPVYKVDEAGSSLPTSAERSTQHTSSRRKSRNGEHDYLRPEDLPSLQFAFQTNAGSMGFEDPGSAESALFAAAISDASPSTRLDPEHLIELSSIFDDPNFLDLDRVWVSETLSEHRTGLQQ